LCWKWFAIQVTSSRPDTPAAVRALARHPDFDLGTPNRVRALVGSFAADNPVRFCDAPVPVTASWRTQ